jgi:hypothetical protein
LAGVLEEMLLGGSEVALGKKSDVLMVQFL